jgi:outer membrane immunogenic protein
MKLGSAIIALLASASTALAADLPRRVETRAPAMVAAPVFNWSGLYLGGHVGGTFAADDIFDNNGARLMGGVQIGADWQFAPNWVLGIEANYSFVDSNDGGGLNFFGNRNLGSVTGRLGYTWGPALLYAKGGYAWADTRSSFGFGDDGGSGYTIGGGFEYMFAQNWSWKLEYQYYDFGDVTFMPVVPLAPLVVASSFSNAEHTIKLGLNYRFNWATGRF